MPFEHYIYSGTKRLRCGYTTGTCAALAAASATRAILADECAATEQILTPAGILVEVPVTCVERTPNSACCSVIKDAGDDVDATDGLAIHARVTLLSSPEVVIDGGEGVGRVTKPGLDQPIGAAAINSSPRASIQKAVRDVFDEYGYEGGVHVTIEVPDGARIALKTFNPHLGIEGGISILGTSGIVEPQSLSAIADTVSLEIHSLREQGFTSLVLTPGNIGESYLDKLSLPQNVAHVKVSNFIGHSLDCAVRDGYSQVLIVGHLGKLVKVAAGVMDTHSHVADARVETIATHAAACGATRDCVLSLFDCATTDACFALLDKAGLLADVIGRIAVAVQNHLDRRVAGALVVGALAFSSTQSLSMITNGARVILNSWSRQTGVEENV